MAGGRGSPRHAVAKRQEPEANGAIYLCGFFAMRQLTAVGR